MTQFITNLAYDVLVMLLALLPFFVIVLIAIKRRWLYLEGKIDGKDVDSYIEDKVAQELAKMNNN